MKHQVVSRNKQFDVATINDSIVSGATSLWLSDTHIEYGKCLFLSKTKNYPIQNYLKTPPLSFTKPHCLTKHVMDCIKVRIKPNPIHMNAINQSLSQRGRTSKYFINKYQLFYKQSHNHLMLKSTLW
jgi:hypothetical protein